MTNVLPHQDSGYSESDRTQELLLTNIYQGDPVEIRFYDSTDPSNRYIESFIRKLLDHYRRTELSDSVRFYIKTLVSNAFQGNIRHAFFREHNLDVNNMTQYVSGLTRFYSRNSGTAADLEKLKSLDLWIKFKACHGPDGVCLEVFNNAPLPQVEEQKLRVKLQKSMLYNSMAQYLRDPRGIPDIGDPGIGLIAILMQRSNLDARLFRVGVNNGVTFSRIEIPFTALYKPKRQLVKN